MTEEIHVAFRNEKLQFAMKPKDSIWTLKQKIPHSKGISANQQTLPLEGSSEPLMDMQTLLDCGITSRSTLLLEADVRQQQVQIFIHSLNCPDIKLDALLSDDVLTMKQKIYVRNRIPPVQQQLTFTGCQLEDHRAVFDYGIRVGSPNHVHLSRDGGVGAKSTLSLPTRLTAADPATSASTPDDSVLKVRMRGWTNMDALTLSSTQQVFLLSSFLFRQVTALKIEGVTIRAVQGDIARSDALVNPTSAHLALTGQVSLAFCAQVRVDSVT